jgi:hypothetical protein
MNRLPEKELLLRQRLPVFATVAAAYREWWRACLALPMLLFSAFIISVAVAAIGDVIPQRLWDSNQFGEILSLAREGIRSVLLSPIVIGIHRFVILDEPASNYVFPVSEPAFWRFVGWLFGLDILTGLPIDLLSFMQALNVSVWTTTVVFFVLQVAAIALAFRLWILLPAIAVDAAATKPALALADTKGYVLRILAITALAAIPWFIVAMIGASLIGRRFDAIGSFPAMIGLLMIGVLQSLLLLLLTVVVSLVFIALGAKTKRSIAPSVSAKA